jgi:molybdopterin-guanine dinucleotide biosynthesis protein MobB
MIKAISIVGFSGSGKTELICRLLAWFGAQKLKVAVLKHTHHKLGPGDEGKDTWRYRQAGAAVTALAAPGLLQISRNFPAEPPLAGSLAALNPETDLILVEGYKFGPLPKIVVLNPELKETPPNFTQVIAVVSPVPVASPGPVFRPEEVEAIGTLILDHLGLSEAAEAED